MRITSPKLSFRANEVLILNYYDNLFLIYNFQKEEGNEVLILYYYDYFFPVSVCAQLSTHYDIRTVHFFFLCVLS